MIVPGSHVRTICFGQHMSVAENKPFSSKVVDESALVIRQFNSKDIHTRTPCKRRHGECQPTACSMRICWARRKHEQNKMVL